MIQVYYTRFKTPLPDRRFMKYLEPLSSKIINQIMAYKRWQDAHASLFGKLLLLDGLRDFGFEVDRLDCLSYNANNKPYIDCKMSFNISHSSEYVVCAFSNAGEIGVDVEELRPVKVNDFKSSFTPLEYELAKEETSGDQRRFYEIWTKKEAVVKALGKGLTVNLSDFNVLDNPVEFDNRNWYLGEVHLSGKYICHWASDQYCDDQTTTLKRLDYYN